MVGSRIYRRFIWWTFTVAGLFSLYSAARAPAQKVVLRLSEYHLAAPDITAPELCIVLSILTFTIAWRYGGDVGEALRQGRWSIPREIVSAFFWVPSYLGYLLGAGVLWLTAGIFRFLLLIASMRKSYIHPIDRAKLAELRVSFEVLQRRVAGDGWRPESDALMEDIATFRYAVLDHLCRNERRSLAPLIRRWRLGIANPIPGESPYDARRRIYPETRSLHLDEIALTVERSIASFGDGHGKTDDVRRIQRLIAWAVQDQMLVAADVPNELRVFELREADLKHTGGLFATTGSQIMWRKIFWGDRKIEI